MPKPRIAHLAGANATIQNSPPLVTSNKAREKYGLPPLTNADGSALRFDVLRPQRLAAPVTVYVEQFSAHPLERDAAELYGPSDGYLDSRGTFHKERRGAGDTPVYEITLHPGDGVYPLPYMARQADGRAWDDDCAQPMAPEQQARQPFYPDGSRLFEEIDRLGVGEKGIGNLISAHAEIDFYRVVPSSGYTKGLAATLRTDVGEGDLAPEVRGRDFFPYRPYHLGPAPPRPALARIANAVQRVLATGKYAGAIWTQGRRSSIRIDVTSVVIIGGGIVGLSAAWHVRRADPAVRVIVLERTAIGAGASGASAAGVRAMGRDPAERAIALASLARWPDLDRDLEGSTGYRRGGGLRVAESETEQAEARADVAAQRADGVPVELVDGDDARRITPGLSSAVLGGIHCRIDGHADASATVNAFANAARALGAAIDEGVAVSSIIVERGRVGGVGLKDGTRTACDVAIVAAGAWTAGLLAPLGARVPLAARGLQMLLTDPGRPALVHVISRVGGRLSLKQLQSGAYLIGGGWPGDVPDESASRGRVRDESARESFALARSVYTPLAHHTVTQSWVGIEAFTPDGLPILGPVAGIEGLFVAAGFCGHGFALAPAVGDILARLALGRDPLAHLWKGLHVERV